MSPERVKRVQAVAQALSHPVREAVLREMMESGTTTPKRCATVVGAPLGVVSYHIHLLRQLRAIKLVSKRPVRGALEHHYEITDLGRHAVRAADFITTEMKGAR